MEHQGKLKAQSRTLNPKTVDGGEELRKSRKNKNKSNM